MLGLMTEENEDEKTKKSRFVARNLEAQ